MKPIQNLLRSWRFYGAARTTSHIWRTLCYQWLRRFTGRAVARCRVHDYCMDVSLRTGGISKVLYIYGGREADLRYMLDHVLRPGAIVLDVGANMGYYALYAARRIEPEGRVIALEPDPRNLGLLRTNITLNQMEGVIEVLPQALSARSGQMEFCLHERSNLSVLLTPGVVWNGTSVQVDVIAARDLLRRCAPVDLMRMDIEGHEVPILDALAAAANEDSTILPTAIVMEVHPERYGSDKLDMDTTLQCLFTLGYRAELASCMLDIFPGIMQSMGYKPFTTLCSDYHIFGLFAHLRPLDVRRAVCELGCVRHLLLRRQPSSV